MSTSENFQMLTDLEGLTFWSKEMQLGMHSKEAKMQTQFMSSHL